MSKKKRESTLYIVDIFLAIDKIKRYSKYFNNAQELLHSDLEWDAVIRELEIIGEATKNLLKVNLLNEECRRIVNFRNHISHGYFGVDEEVVWNVVNIKLLEFREDLIEIICINNIDLDEAIETIKQDNNFSKETISFLNKFKSEVFEIIKCKSKS